MSNKGYSLEHETEQWLVKYADQTFDMPYSERCRRITSSGAIRGDKGDVISYNIPWFAKQILIECKRRKEKRKTGKVVTLVSDWLSKAVEEAVKMNRVPLVLFSFYKANLYRKWIAFRERDISYLSDLKPVVVHVIVATTGKRRKGNFVIYYEQAKELASTGDGFMVQTKNDNWLIVCWDDFVKHLEKWKETTQLSVEEVNRMKEKE